MVTSTIADASLPRVGSWSPPAVPDARWLGWFEEILPELVALGQSPSALVQRGHLAQGADGVYRWTAAGREWLDSVRRGQGARVTGDPLRVGEGVLESVGFAIRDLFGIDDDDRGPLDRALAGLPEGLLEVAKGVLVLVVGGAILWAVTR